MKYDFSATPDRRGSGCVKWDEQPPVAIEGGQSLIPLWVADMDFAVAPAIQEAIRRRAEHPVFGYTHVGDDYYLAVCNWFKRRHNWTIAREHLLYTIGVVPAITCALKALALPGESVLLLSPDYNCFFSCIRNAGCQPSESALVMSGGRFSVDWQDFEARCADEKTTVFLLCSPHNPTGRVWSRDELQHMADICRRHSVRVVSDEIHCELLMPGSTFVPMGTVEPQAVVLNSPSKAFNIAGLQMANIVCTDDSTRRRINRIINIHETCDVNPFAPEAVKAAYNDSADWLDELNEYVSGNYRLLADYCGERLEGWHLTTMEGTYLAWVDVSRCCGDSVAQYCDRLLAKTGVWLNAGTMYGKESGRGFLRVNLACSRQQLQEALDRIASAMPL